MDEKVIGCIYDAIDEANRERGDEPPLEKSLTTPIHGTESALDSLGLVNFVILVEENVESAFAVPITLSDDRALTAKPSPFLTVSTLAEYLERLLEEALAGQPDDRPLAGSRPVCIIGCGRSGTSVAARAVSLLGVDLGSQASMQEADRWNPTGYWEQREVNALNSETLYALGGNPVYPPEPAPDWEHAPSMAPFRARAASLIADTFGEGRWAFKDSRTTFTVPLWRSVAGEFDYVICVRNPLEVCESAKKVFPESGFAELPSDEYLLNLWAHYICEALRQSAGQRRFFAFYDDWFADRDAVGRRLAAFLGIEPDAVEDGVWEEIASLVDPQLHRNRSREDDLTSAEVPEAAREVYFRTRDLAAAEERGDWVQARELQRTAVTLDASFRHYSRPGVAGSPGPTL